MQDLLNHPAVQAAIIPFFVSAILAMALVKVRHDVIAIVILAGFLTTCLLITDVSLQTLTSTKKIIILTILATLWGLILQFRPVKNYPLLALIAIISLLACSWLLWPVLSRKEFFDATVILLGLSFYNFVIVALAAVDRSSPSPKPSNIEFYSIAILYAVVISILCVIATSALYGQMAAALAASAGGYLLVGLLTGNELIRPLKDRYNKNSLFTIILFFPVSLIAVAATIYADLPWYVLLFLATIPAMLFVKISETINAWKRLGVRILLCSIPASMSLYLTLEAAGPVLY